MKRKFTLLFLLTLLACKVIAQPSTLPENRQDLQETPLKFKPYFVANMELLGPVMYGISIPGHFRGRSVPFWPAWIVGNVEAGLTPKSSVIVGGAFRYARARWNDFPQTYYFRNGQMEGAKVLIGYRHYLGKGLGEGFYLQPTAKFVYNHYREYSSDVQREDAFRDYLFSVRFGFQKRLGEHLALSASMGPGLGFRYDNLIRYYDFYDLWYTELSEIDLPHLRIIDRYGRNNFTTFLVGDASLALGWYF